MDPIADLLVAIKNGYLARRDTVTLPHSNFKVDLCAILAKHNYIKSTEIIEDGFKKNLVITLNYFDEHTPVLSGVKRVSKPSVRQYVDADSLRFYLNSGLTIISTSQGLLTAREALAKNLGGEVICQIW